MTDPAPRPAPDAARHPVQPGPRRRKRSLASRGWIPDYHGAWAMVFVPLILGIILGGVRLIHLPLSLAWVVGYFTYFALTKWYISRFQTRFRPPVLVYGGITAACGVALVLLAPQLLYWAPWYAVLIAVTVVATVQRRERSLFARTMAIVAGVLMGCVAYDAGTGFVRDSFRWLPLPQGEASAALPGHNWAGTVTGWSWMWLLSLVLLLYFVGTVTLVKTVIRERNSTPYLVGSVLYHVVLVVLAVAAAVVHWTGWVLVALSVVLLLRALYFPLSMRLQGKRWTAKVIGVTEIVMTAAVEAALFLP